MPFQYEHQRVFGVQLDADGRPSGALAYSYTFGPEGWPDPDSVFVRLRHPFRTRPSPLPEGVDYTEPDDPHWWRADYSSRSPRHLLAC